MEYAGFEMQKYLESKDLTTTQKKIIFNARTGILPVGYNFGQKIPCFACEMAEDTDRHLLKYVFLKMTCPDLMENTEFLYDDIFGMNMLKVAKVSSLLRSALRAREIMKSNFG